MRAGALLLVALLVTGVTTRLMAAEHDIVIYACYNNASGEVKIVGEDDTCKKNWTKIEWNDEGPQGDQGLQGDQGPVGEDGVAGEDGADGANGTNGADGTNGTNGTDGADGADGAQGPAGPNGISGMSGYQIVNSVEFRYVSASEVTVTCPSGKKVLGGGWRVMDGFVVPARMNYPKNSTTWAFMGHHSLGSNPRLSVYAVCAYAN